LENEAEKLARSLHQQAIEKREEHQV
jgi:hypothetical protein